MYKQAYPYPTLRHSETQGWPDLLDNPTDRCKTELTRAGAPGRFLPLSRHPLLANCLTIGGRCAHTEGTEANRSGNLANRSPAAVPRACDP